MAEHTQDVPWQKEPATAAASADDTPPSVSAGPPVTRGELIAGGAVVAATVVYSVVRVSQALWWWAWWRFMAGPWVWWVLAAAGGAALFLVLWPKSRASLMRRNRGHRWFALIAACSVFGVVTYALTRPPAGKECSFIADQCVGTGDYGSAIPLWRQEVDDPGGSDGLAKFDALALARCHVFAVENAPNEQWVVSAVRKTWECDEATAMMLIGGACLKEKVAPTGHQSDAEAVKWFRRAADLGDPKGMTALAQCYAVGRGLPRDPGEYAKWLRRAVDAGDPGAMRELGQTMLAAKDNEAARREGAEWLRKAAEREKRVRDDIWRGR